MGYEWIDQYCLSKKGTQKDYKPEWEATRYMLFGKMYLMAGSDKEGRPIVTFKLPPMDGVLMREQYKDIIPGYYMNKEHWNSMYLEGTVPDDVVKDMLDESYRILLTSLTKKAQKEIEESL